MRLSALRTKPALLTWKTPRDGVRRYLLDIWQPLAVLAVTACFTATFYAIYRDPYTSRDFGNRFNYIDMFFCNADGKVEKTRADYDPLWDPQLYFAINLAFGEFAFSTVRVLDTSWDAIVGRGGQMLVAMMAYRTLRRSFALSMETSAVSIPTVTTLYCHQIQLTSLFKLASEFCSHRDSGRSKRKLIWYMAKIRLGLLILACLYVLFFATLVSVMAGYRAQLSGYFQSPNGLVPLSELSQPDMIVYNTSRIGLPDSPLYAREQISLPPMFNAEGEGKDWDIGDYLVRSGEFEEPYGTLVDCKYPANRKVYALHVPISKTLTLGRFFHLSWNPPLDVQNHIGESDVQDA